jgi:protein gp37
VGSTSIEWTDVTWNPVRGCTRVSEGCRNCYAEVMAARFSDHGFWGCGFATRTNHGGRWTGTVALVPEKLAEPLSWRKPRKCFVNSMSDLFHEALSFDDIAAVYGIMAACPHITFQVLTKRPERRREFFAWVAAHRNIAGDRADVVMEADERLGDDDWTRLWEAAASHWYGSWPLPNVVEGTSIENQETADRRIHELRETPAAVRFLSCEPLLGPIVPDLSGIHWVVVGGESGRRARPMHPDWARSLRDQCQEAGVAFHFKQWGQFKPIPTGQIADPGVRASSGGDEFVMWRCKSKKDAGRLLDGREWNEYPEVPSA